MKKLFDRFEEYRGQARAALEACLSQLDEGFAPDAALRGEMRGALDKLGTTYDAILAALPDCLPPDERPEGRLSVRQCEAIYSNSFRVRRRAALAVLERFISVFAEEQKYTDAVEPYITSAKDLLVRTGESEMPDVSVYRLFLDGLEADLSADEALYDKLLDDSPFSPRIVKGLYEGKYRVRAHEADEEIAEESEATETAETEQAAAGESETAEAEQAAAEAAEATEAQAQAVEQAEIPEVYIHPVNPIREIKLPSEQKLAEIISRTGPVFALLLDRLSFTGLEAEQHIFMPMDKPLDKQRISGALDLLERRGLLCAYEYEGEHLLCFTELMKKCLQKASLAALIKRVLKIKRLQPITFAARQDMPLSRFTAQLTQVRYFTRVSDNYACNADALLKKYNCFSYNTDTGFFTMNMPVDAGKPLPLRIVGEADLATLTPAEGEGLFCGADTLPDMSGVSDDMRYCVTPKGLFQWKSGKWIAIAPADAEPIAETEAEATGEAEESTPEPVFEPEPAAEATIEPEPAAEPASEPEAEPEPEPITEPAAEPASEPEPADEPVNEAADEIKAEPEPDRRSSTELARQLLDEATGDHIPTDAQMAELIDRMLAEGERSHDISRCRDQIVEALVLAKLLSDSGRFPACAALYAQLHAAVPFLQDGAANGGDALTNIFATETKYTPAARLCAYIYGMLFPARAHDYTFASLSRSAFVDFEAQFPGFEALKPLYHKAMQAPETVPAAFSPANLSMLLDARLRAERMADIRQRACELLKLPTVKVMINGVPELIDLCFGPESELHEAVNIVAENDVARRELVELTLDAYSRDGEIDTGKVDETLNRQWSVAAQKYSSRRMGVKYGLRKQLLRDFEERFDVLRDWLDETASPNAQHVEKLRPIRSELLGLIDASLTRLGEMPYTVDVGIVSAALDLIGGKLESRGALADFSTLLRSGALVIDHSLPVFNDNLNGVRYAEPWRMMLTHIACEDYDLREVYDKILRAGPEDTLYDNFGQLEAIGRLISADPQQYTLTAEGLSDAVSSARFQARVFREKLEISYAYNRVSEIDRERLAQLADPDTSSFRDFFYEHRAFGCWRAFLNALQAQVDESTQRNTRLVRELLEKARRQLKPDEESLLLTEAERLIGTEQNFAVAEDYIRRFRNGERALPFESNDGATDYFLDFVCDAVFPGLYDYCERHKDSPLSRSAIQYIERNRPEGWTSRHMEDAKQFIDKWPRAKQSVDQAGIQGFFRLLGLDVVRCKRYMRGSEVCFTLTVGKSKQNQADYRHPIAMFGTQMKPEIEAVCLFGKRTAKQIIDDACKLGIPSTFIVLLDADLSAQDRRMMAQYFFTQKNVGQASFLVIDRVLALYLALQPSNERLPAMLQCTLPYTIYQPFTNGSGSTADEMFFGRVSELAAIRDMTGTSIVYGGRQLGKTALLERAKHLDNNPERNEFAVMTNFKGCRGERAFLDRLVPACNETLAKGGIRLRPCGDIAEFCAQIRQLLDDGRVTTLRLLLDEADDFLDSVSSSSYSEILPLIELQRGSNRRFKFVLAGLHNVCRAKNATRNNGLFGQLGAPLCVKPLTASDARNLLLRPLRYLGFKVSNESHIDTMLINTNYYPGIIQFFGYTLVQTLASQYTHYYDPVRGNPPYDLRDEQLASIMNSKDLNHSIKERLRWTLEMDERYYMLARCVTLLYHMSEDQSSISNGFGVGEILEVAKDMFNIRCLAQISERDCVTLLDEMEEMGILSRPVAGEDRYLLRRRSFIDVIGANLEVLERDLTSEGATEDV